MLQSKVVARRFSQFVFLFAFVQICSCDSSDIEREYKLNPQGKLHFTTHKYSYTLDFSSIVHTQHERVCFSNSQRFNAMFYHRNVSSQPCFWDN